MSMISKFHNFQVAAGDDKSNQDGSGELPGSPVHEAVGVEVQGLSEVHKEGSNQEDSKNVSSPSILLSS